MGLKPKPEKSALSAQVSTAKWHVTVKLIVLVLAITGLASANGGAKPLQGEDRNSRGTGKLSPELTTLILKAQRTGSSNARVQVIVQFRKSPTIAHIKKATRLGGVHTQTLRLVRTGVFNLSLSAIQALAKDPEVTYISPNRTVGVSNDYYESPQQYRHRAVIRVI